MTLLSSTIGLSAPFVEVRCDGCGRLLCKWMRSGLTTLDLKCPRCGSRQVVALST